MSNSIQDRLGRDRPPRVHIHYKVEKGNAIELKELPFVVGILADLSGQRREPLAELSKRNPVDVLGGDIDKLMKDAKPRVAFTVPNVLSDREGGATELPVDIEFTKFADFSPTSVAKSLPPLAKLLEIQQSLMELKRRIMAQPDAGKRLDKVFKNHDLLDTILKAQAEDPAAAPPADGAPKTEVTPS